MIQKVSRSLSFRWNLDYSALNKALVYLAATCVSVIVNTVFLACFTWLIFWKSEWILSCLFTAHLTIQTKKVEREAVTSSESEEEKDEKSVTVAYKSTRSAVSRVFVSKGDIRWNICQVRFISFCIFLYLCCRNQRDQMTWGPPLFMNWTRRETKMLRPSLNAARRFKRWGRIIWQLVPHVKSYKDQHW